jgi:hypothetical protein
LTLTNIDLFLSEPIGSHQQKDSRCQVQGWVYGRS